MFVLYLSINQEKIISKITGFGQISDSFTAFCFYFAPINGAVFYSLKLSLMLLFLLLMRGGTPRYRYDYLTKLGWLKFLGFALLVILSLLTLALLFSCNQLYLIFDHQ
jgi:NADH:ubiquinone oxidoreductase subunit H